MPEATLADIASKVGDLGSRLDSVVTKADVEPLQKELNTLKTELATLKSGRATDSDIYFPTQVNPRAFKTRKAAFLFGMGILARINRESPVTKGKFQWAEDWLTRNNYPLEKTSQSEGTSTLGGFTVFDQISNEVIDLREQYGIFRQNARVITLSTDFYRQPRRTAGLTGYWVSEGGTITESNKTFDQITLTPKKRAYLASWTSELGEDSVINFADDLAMEMAWQLSQIEDQCGFIGDGTSTYAGMRGLEWKFETENTSLAGLVTAATGNVSFETLDLTDFHAAMGKLPLYALGSAKWYISAYGFAASMQRLMYAGGGNTVTTIQGGSGFAFLGYPVVISQVLNATAGSDVSQVKALFGDLRRSSTMGVRRSLDIDVSDQLYFASDRIAVRGTSRFDINNHDVGDNTTVGPVVALRTASS